jgi:hypothetical protein
MAVPCRKAATRAANVRAALVRAVYGSHQCISAALQCIAVAVLTFEGDGSMVGPKNI